MSRHSSLDRPRSVLLSFRFLGASVLGSLAMALAAALAPLAAQIAALGAGLSVLVGLVVCYVEQEEERERRRERVLETLRIPIALAPEHEFFTQYCGFARSLVAVAEQTDPVLRQFTLLKLTSVNEQVRSLAEGRVVFSGTETWRTVYEQILESLDSGPYLSVAWAKTPDYWQDQPGRQSMQVNYRLAARGLVIERIIIIRDEFWPVGAPLPSPELANWIANQYEHGLSIFLIREGQVAAEPELLGDFAVYGERATGVQELDEQSRTLRFVLNFNRQAIDLARDRWERIALFSTPYLDVLDRAGLYGPRCAD
jgi:hypothetical protein